MEVGSRFVRGPFVLEGNARPLVQTTCGQFPSFGQLTLAWLWHISTRCAHFPSHALPPQTSHCTPTAIEAVKHFSLFAHFLSGIAVLVFYYCGNQEEKDKYLNRLLVACMSLLTMAIALPPFGLPKPESHDLQNKGFEIPKISQEPLKKD